MLTSTATIEPGMLMLSAGDFPVHFRDGRHPEDLVVADRPIAPEYVYHNGGFGHLRILWRAAWCTPAGRFVPVTFVVDTGAPLPVYLSVAAYGALRDCGVLCRDSAGEDYVSIFDRRYRVVETPPGHEPGNILGLRAIMDLGLCVNEEGSGFRFRCPDVVQP